MPDVVASYNRGDCADHNNLHVVSKNMTERSGLISKEIAKAEVPSLSSKTHAQDHSFALISEAPLSSHDDASKGTERDVAEVVPKLQLLFIVTKESLEQIYRRTMKSALDMAKYLCIQRLVWIGTIASTHALSLLIFLRKSRLSARMLCIWIFVNLMLPLKSLLDTRHSKLNCKINPVSIAAATTSSTQTPKNLRDCNNFSSDSGAHFVTYSSLSDPFPEPPLQSRLHESKRSPIRTISAPSSISLSSTKESSRPLQKVRKQLKSRSNKTTRNYLYASDAKIDSRSVSVMQNPSVQINVSEKPTMFNIFPKSSLNSKQQTSIDLQSKQRTENTFTLTKLRQTTSKAAPKLSRKSGAVTVWSISLLLVLSALSLGRLPAILFTSLTWIAFSLTTAFQYEKGRNKNFLGSFSRTETIGQKMNKCSTSATNNLVDFTSNNYKKKVIMEGLLERNPGSFCCFLRSP